MARPEILPQGGECLVRGKVGLPGRARLPVHPLWPGAGPGRCDTTDGAGRDGLPGDDRQPAHDESPRPQAGPHHRRRGRGRPEGGGQAPRGPGDRHVRD